MPLKIYFIIFDVRLSTFVDITLEHFFQFYNQKEVCGGKGRAKHARAA